MAFYNRITWSVEESVWWVNPCRQLNTTQPLSHTHTPALQWDRGENRKDKTEKSHGSKKNETKQASMSDAKAIAHHQ